MSHTWKWAVVGLQLGLSVLIMFASAACAAASTPAPPNTLDMEVTVRSSPEAGGTAMPASTPGPKATSEENGEIPAKANGQKDTPGSIRRSGGTGRDDQALPIPG